MPEAQAHGPWQLRRARRAAPGCESAAAYGARRLQPDLPAGEPDSWSPTAGSGSHRRARRARWHFRAGRHPRWPSCRRWATSTRSARRSTGSPGVNFVLRLPFGHGDGHGVFGAGTPARHRALDITVGSTLLRTGGGRLTRRPRLGRPGLSSPAGHGLRRAGQPGAERAGRVLGHGATEEVLDSGGASSSELRTPGHRIRCARARRSEAGTVTVTATIANGVTGTADGGPRVSRCVTPALPRSPR